MRTTEERGQRSGIGLGNQARCYVYVGGTAHAHNYNHMYARIYIIHAHVRHAVNMSDKEVVGASSVLLQCVSM